MQNRTSIKNKIHAILLMNGIRITAKPFTKEFVAELRNLTNYRIDGYLSLLDSLKEQIDDASSKVREISENDEETKLLISA